MKVSEALRRLGSAASFPRTAMLCIRDNWKEAAPVASKMLEQAVSEAETPVQTLDALFFLLHLAAEQQDKTFHAPLCRLAAQPDLPDVVLGDATTMTLPSLLVSTFDGDPASIKAVIEAPLADEFTRASALHALAWLTHDGQFARAHTHDYLTGLFDRLMPAEASYVWVGLADAIAALGFEDLAPRVERLHEQRWIDPSFMGLNDFRKMLRASLAGLPDAFSGLAVGPFTDAVKTLESWHYGRRDRNKIWVDNDPEWQAGPEPWVNPSRHVGRNDPCPCGSGVKFKKCCLGVDAAGTTMRTTITAPAV